MIDCYTNPKYLYGSNKGGNMFGSDEENKNKIEQLEEKVEALEIRLLTLWTFLKCKMMLSLKTMAMTLKTKTIINLFCCPRSFWGRG